MTGFPLFSVNITFFEESTPMSSVNCFQCQFYYVTWEKKHPHGCRKMGFKSLQVPNCVVRKNSSRDCLLFKHRASQKRD